MMSEFFLLNEEVLLYSEKNETLLEAYRYLFRLIIVETAIHRVFVMIYGVFAL